MVERAGKKRRLLALPGPSFRQSTSIRATGSCWAIPDPEQTLRFAYCTFFHTKLADAGHPQEARIKLGHDSSSSSALASCRTGVSNPSVNQP
jgi:hypothetical protein